MIDHAEIWAESKPKRPKDVVFDAIVDGLGVEDIAARTGLPEVTIRRYIATFRAKGWLKHMTAPKRPATN